MKGLIEKRYGVLSIERAGKMVECFCALKVHNEWDFWCGHVCPAFREPVKRSDGKIELQLCDEVGTLLFDEFTDERGG